MIPFEYHLRGKYYFRKIFHSGNFKKTPFFSIHWIDDTRLIDRSLFATTVSKKFHKRAHERNRAKRLIFDSIKDADYKSLVGKRVIFVPFRGLPLANKIDRDKAMRETLSKI